MFENGRVQWSGDYIEKDYRMRIAIPLVDGKLSQHFGHLERVVLIDVDTAEKKIIRQEEIEVPPLQPGLLSFWLAERGVKMVIAGGMGQRAQDMFAEQDIQVLIGVQAETPENLVTAYLAGTLEEGENTCDR